MSAPITLNLRARAFATAWLNAILATSKDKDRPLLFRTMSVELFRDGVQLISTNGHALFRTWVPSIDAINYPTPFPLVEEAPALAVVVQDASNFAKTFLQTVYAATAGEDGGIETLVLTVAPVVDEAEPPLSEELQKSRLTLAALGQELHCPLFEQEYPNWRALNFGIDRAELVDGMTIAPAMFAMVGRLRAVWKVDCSFHGQTKAIVVHATGDTEVLGLLMPMRREDAERTVPDPEPVEVTP
jgi:hypothetical protein